MPKAMCPTCPWRASRGERQQILTMLALSANKDIPGAHACHTAAPDEWKNPTPEQECAGHRRYLNKQGQANGC